MSSYEWNKVAGAILLAGLIAMMSGFLARQLVSPHHVERLAYALVQPGEKAAIPGGKEAPAPAEIPPVAPLLAKADVAAGEQVAKKCTQCHTFQKGGKNGVGPNLWGVVGNRRAHLDNFAFSKGMTDSKDQLWDYEALNKFVTSPKSVVPGTKMAFPGLPKAEDRANVIAWLRTQSDNPPPLP
ncbi:MAG: cytochrome c family protein [Proteobacteria bacterium]|nr:cytochrome c family protein [Pseudomonadota bacterium]MBI3496433.1 cytochrome c family protein [Pseudomonadota bacterium]